MARAIHTHPWGSTSIGPIEQWPSALRTALSMVLNSKFPQAIVWGSELITFYNDAFKPVLGSKPEALGRSFRDVWSEAWTTLEPMVKRSFAGEATFLEDMPLVVNRDGQAEEAYFTFCYSPIRDDIGSIVGILDTVVETTEAVEARRSARMLNAELAHRIQNTLAVTSAIVEQTFRAGHDADETRRRINERIAALGRAHALLTRTNWKAAPIETLVHEALAPHAAPAQLRIEGPPLDIPAKKALSLSLALHELATNAVKYGALSIPAGRVGIEWRMTGAGSDRGFEFTWIETNGPPAIEPREKGFGSRLLERILPHDFGGTSRLLYGPTGLRYELRRQGSFSTG
jgi:two-component sensor histidine kinase